MSFYNMLHGFDDNAPQLLKYLAIDPRETGRFRDAFLQMETGKPVINILTRNGGGNRPEFENQTIKLRAHPLFLRDYDDEFDCTFANYLFKIPDDEITEEMVKIATSAKTLRQKTMTAIEAMKRKP